jgi:hypothetical protein
MEHPVLITAVITIVFFIFTPFIIQIITLLILPGRKGRMRTERGVYFSDITVEQARAIFKGRLRRERFRIDPNPIPNYLYATRHKPSPVPYAFLIRSFSNIPLKAEITFKPDAGGVSVSLTLWYKNIVLGDTGEDLYIRALLRRILEEDLDEEPPPRILRISDHIKTATITSALLCIAPFLMFHFFFNKYRALGLTIGLIFYSIVNITVVNLGFREIKKKPEEIKGKELGHIAIFLSIIGAILAIGFYCYLARISGRFDI